MALLLIEELAGFAHRHADELVLRALTLTLSAASAAREHLRGSVSNHTFSTKHALDDAMLSGHHFHCDLPLMPASLPQPQEYQKYELAHPLVRRHTALDVSP
jgi:hypothetical protein